MHPCLHAPALTGNTCSHPIPCCLQGDQTSSSQAEPTKDSVMSRPVRYRYYDTSGDWWSLAGKLLKPSQEIGGHQLECF